MTVSVPKQVSNTNGSTPMLRRRLVSLLRQIALLALELSIATLIGLALTLIVINLPFAG